MTLRKYLAGFHRGTGERLDGSILWLDTMSQQVGAQSSLSSTDGVDPRESRTETGRLRTVARTTRRPGATSFRAPPRRRRYRRGPWETRRRPCRLPGWRRETAGWQREFVLDEGVFPGQFLDELAVRLAGQVRPARGPGCDARLPVEKGGVKQRLGLAHRTL